MSSLLGIDLYELLHVEKNVGELLGGEEAGHHHRPVELLVDDPQISPVLDLCLDDLCDDLFALAAASRAGVAQRRGQEAPAIRTAAKNTGKQLSVAVWCGSGMFIPDPDFYPSKKCNKRERRQKICCHIFFCSHKFHKIVN